MEEDSVAMVNVETINLGWAVKSNNMARIGLEQPQVFLSLWISDWTAKASIEDAMADACWRFVKEMIGMPL